VAEIEGILKVGRQGVSGGIFTENEEGVIVEGEGPAF